MTFSCKSVFVFVGDIGDFNSVNVFSTIEIFALVILPHLKFSRKPHNILLHMPLPKEHLKLGNNDGKNFWWWNRDKHNIFSNIFIYHNELEWLLPRGWILCPLF